MPRRLLLAAGAAATVALAPLAAAPAGLAATVPAAAPLTAGFDAGSSLDSVLDVRRTAAAVLPTSAQVDAMRALLSAAPARARVTWDPVHGTPRSIRGTDGYLSGPASGSAVEVARGWLAAHRAAFGLSASDIAGLQVTRDHALPGTGTHVVTFTQVISGAPAVHGGRLNVAVTREGKILAYTGDPARATDLAGGWSLSPAQALAKVASVLGGVSGFVPTATGSKAGYLTFAKGPFAAGSYVQKAVFPTSSGARAAYRVLFVKALDQAWDTVVDASTGQVLFRASAVAHDAAPAGTDPGAPEGLVYENFPGAARGGAPVLKSFGPTAESPAGWVDPTGALGLPGPTTFGNNANTYANYSNYLVPADQGPRPVSPTSQFVYPYDQNWQKSKGATLPPSYALDLNAAATNLFYQHNRIHDELYDLGFTETAGNFQVNNEGKGGQGGDPILGLVHAGAATGGSPTYTGRDNAYMLTLDDGIPPWSGMFLWEPINDAFEGPYSDGTFDVSVIEHEYVHGLSNRYVAGGGALNSQQAGSMGEGWSDWYALNHLYTAGLQNKAVVGQYVTGNATRGIRNDDYDQNPTNYGDLGYDLTGPEVHADGEIWTATLWDLRKALVAKYGAAAGGERAARLITDGMPLTAPNPSMLDARDGILSADLDRYHGDDTQLLWQVFAKRGMGASARSKTGDDIHPVPGFDSLAPGDNGTLAGRVVNASTGQPVPGARVIVGVYEARVSPVAKTSSTGGFAARMVPGTYPLLVQARGFGVQHFTVSVTAGRTTGVTLRLAPNLASAAMGATVASASSQDAAFPAKNLIDDTAATVWSTDQAASTPYNQGPDQRVTVKLPKLESVSAIQVSAYKDTGASRFAALKDFTFQVSTDGVVFRTVKTGGFSYQAPRPVAPDLNYRTFRLSSPVQARYLRFFADSVQGDTTSYAQVADLQVFGNAGALTPTTLPTQPPFTDSGTISVGNPAAGDPTGLQNVYGVTGTDFTSNCGTMPPASQGADGWVSALPDGFGDGTHSVQVTGKDTTGAGYDLDLYFLDAKCQLVGEAASAAVDESAVIPGGTRYVLTQLWTGANTPFTLTAKSAQ